MDYVQTIQPSAIEEFSGSAPATVVEAMRISVTNLLGTLPPAYFSVNISMRLDNFAQLLYSIMLTGYMYRNALYRMELRSTLATPFLPSGEPAESQPEPAAQSQTDLLYAPGTQKTHVSGEVLRWHHETGAEAIPAAQYIENLEREIVVLKQQAARNRLSNQHGNQLCDYIKSLDPETVEMLTKHAGEDVHEAMTAFIDRMLGTSDTASLANMTECDGVELARLLYWICIVGYSLRSLEVRFDVANSLDMGDLDDY